MLFVNNIGEVCHSMVDRFAGAANKNIGDAFLLVWKMPDEKYVINEMDNSVEFKDKNYILLFAGDKSFGIFSLSPFNATIMNALKP